jgi:hypothetical protein
MQDQYFSLWLGKYTTAIDWTAAVTNTYVSATLSSLSHSIDYNTSGTCGIYGHTIDNEINKYFSHTTAFYFVEEAFAVRMQAFDDMLWLVLEWLSSIKFIESHASTHHETNAPNPPPWHAKQFIPTFAHRSHIFYSLAEKGWDWHLCGGGMTWSPHLLPYKNAITNQLFISASIDMYLHFPGDSNCSPFLSPFDAATSTADSCNDSNGPYNPAYRHKAIDGYTWLKNSHMLNEKGLYTDGFHIAGYGYNRSATECDERNEMVYSYNQGVILSGLRGLWEATGNTTYLSDGYDLIANVVKATGWRAKDGRWKGLGRNGVLMDSCDETGRCNQDGQAFKGIFFHHLVAFCEVLPVKPAREGRTYVAGEKLARMHRRRCEGLTEWVVHNARAAMGTRDGVGRFGGWWGAPRRSGEDESGEGVFVREMPKGAVDYRNDPALTSLLDIDTEDEGGTVHDRRYADTKPASSGDANDRGRGRTVETQGSGLAVVRAMYEFLKLNESV